MNYVYCYKTGQHKKLLHASQQKQRSYFIDSVKQGPGRRSKTIQHSPGNITKKSQRQKNTTLDGKSTWIGWLFGMFVFWFVGLGSLDAIRNWIECFATCLAILLDNHSHQGPFGSFKLLLAALLLWRNRLWTEVAAMDSVLTHTHTRTQMFHTNDLFQLSLEFTFKANCGTHVAKPHLS